MPTYTMINIETEEEQEMVLSFAEREELLNSGKYKQKLSTAKFISQHGSTLNKTSSGWKDLLGKMKKNNPRSNINI